MLKLDLVKQIEAVDPSTYSINFGVMDMAHDLGKVMRGIKAAPRDDNSMWVYRPKDTYPMGYIVYADLMDSSDGEKRYSVFSPNISNGKYTHGEREFMASALHRGKAVKNAAKHLRPLSTEQVLHQVQGRFIDEQYVAQGQRERENHQLRNKVDTRLFSSDSEPPMLSELKRILQSGYEFGDKELEADLRVALQAWEDKRTDKIQRRDAKFSFVEIVQQVGQTVFRGYGTAPQHRSFRAYYNANQSSWSDTEFTYTQEELPEHMTGGVSVLSMVDVGQYVDGVGYRAADNMFYVKCV